MAMEPSCEIPPDKEKISIVHQQSNKASSLSLQSNSSIAGVTTTSHQNLDKLSRPMAFDKMEIIVREMQDPENGVPVRQQKTFLTSIPYAFMGYDLIEWLMDHLSVEESEALSLANQLCLHGYFFPVNDTKTLVVKDDSSLYRFQTPYYWPWQHKAPDNVEYAIYLAKRSLRNKQRHGLEDYESEALASLHKNLKGKWDFISMQAEEQVRLAKERKKGDKIVGDSQERAYWRVHRPPPGLFTPLEPCPVPTRDRQGSKPKKKTLDDWQREVDYLKKSLGRTRMKMSQACESLVNYCETFIDYDFFMQPVLPSNPWISEDITFWQLNNALVDIPTEKRVKRWAISIEELVADPTGLQEFTTFLEKEYSHENIRFWIAVNKLRRSAHSQVAKKVNAIYEEFLKPGAPCEINIDGKTMEVVQKGLKNPSRFTFDAAAEHIYMLLLKKDCYPRFIRSEHYKSLLASGIQPSHKKRFFGFGGVAKKKATTTSNINQTLTTQPSTSGILPATGNLSRRRGSDRSLSGSAHELTIINVKDITNKVPHSHSQNNLSDVPYSVEIYRGDMPGFKTQIYSNYPCRRVKDNLDQQLCTQETSKLSIERLEATQETEACSVCPWETKSSPESSNLLSVCPWDEKPNNVAKTKENTTIADVTEVSERMKRSCGLRQNTVDSDYNSKRLSPYKMEQRRASMTIPSTLSEFQYIEAKHSTLPNVISSTETTFQKFKDKESVPVSLVLKRNSSISSGGLPDVNIEFKEDSSKNEELKQLIKNEESIIACDSNKVVGCQTSPDLKLSVKSGATTPIIQIDTPHTIDKIEIKREETNLQVIENLSTSKGNINETEINQQIDLSPTADEYQECSQFEKPIDFDYGIDECITPAQGCIAPAPTPSPILAPLAEFETDPVEDDPESLDIKKEIDDAKKHKRKKESGLKNTNDKSEGDLQKPEDDLSHNTVCPWEDEDLNSATDTPFVKTYATLGYL